MEQANKSDQLNHLQYIDAIRGLAFLWVLSVHCAGSVGQFPFRWFFLLGSFGVQMFFLASAVTLCMSFSARSSRDRYPVLFFYLRRLFRIAPLFWIAMAAYWTLPNLMPSFWLSYWAPVGVHAPYFILTALFLHGWHPYTFNSIVPGGWSIAVEMGFYSIFPFMFARMRSLKASLIAVCVLIPLQKAAAHFVFPVLRAIWWGDTQKPIWDFFSANWFPSQLVVFLIGILLFWALNNLSSVSAGKKKIVCLLCLLSSVVLFALVTRFKVSPHLPSYLPIVFSLAGFIFAMAGGVLRSVANPIICYVGRISFSCYLTHFAMLGCALKLLGMHLTERVPALDLGNGAANLWLFGKLAGLTLILTIPVSTLTLHLVERKGINLGRKIISRLSYRTSEAMKAGDTNPLTLEEASAEQQKISHLAF